MNNNQLWEAVLGEIELNLSKANFTTWFKNTFISSFKDKQVVVCVPNTFTKAWLEKKYHSLILDALINVSGKEVETIYYKVELKKEGEEEVENIESKQINRGRQEEENRIKLHTGGDKHVNNLANSNTNISQNNFNNTQNSLNSNNLIGQEKKPRLGGFVRNELGLNSKYTFDNYIVGKGNELAHAACQAVAANPGCSYNPLFIYGGVGLGKTHLLQAIGHHVSKKTDKILYVTCEKFTNDYIQAVRDGQAKDFKERYRNVDLLLIDDIQFMAGKDGTQEEFFHTFNELHQTNKQIVLTSDRPPKSIPSLEKRLLSRFEWGMIADVTRPDIETRIAILESKCKERGYELNGDIVYFIANNVQNNIRELEGALNRVIAYHEFNNTEPTIDTIKSILSNLITNIKSKSVTNKNIIEIVSTYFDVSMSELLGKSRKKELVYSRQITMYLMRKELNTSFPTIGAELGGRDHTTAMHSFNKILREVVDNERIQQDIESIKEKLNRD